MATQANMPAHASQGGGDRTVTALTRELIRECEALARAEAALVKSEISEKISQAESGIAALAVGVATLAGGLLVLLFAAVFALDRVLELWLSALIVGGVVTLIGVIMLSSGKRTMRAENLTPERTLEELRRGPGMAKEQAR